MYVKENMFIEFGFVFFPPSLSRNFSGPVGWRDATWLWSSSECPVRHGGRHPFPTPYLHKLSPLRFGAQQWYSSAGPDRGSGSWSASCSRYTNHQRVHVQHGQQRQQSRCVTWRLRADSTQRGWAAEGEEKRRVVPEIHPVRAQAEEVRVQELSGLPEVETEFIQERGWDEYCVLCCIWYQLYYQVVTREGDGGGGWASSTLSGSGMVY